MDDATAQKIKQALDAELANVRPTMGVAFGEDLFIEFRRRAWITWETFTAFGTDAFPVRLPAYNKTHYAHLSIDVDHEKFLVGHDA